MYLSHSERHAVAQSPHVYEVPRCNVRDPLHLSCDQVCKAPLSAASFAPAAPNVHMCKIDTTLRENHTLLDAPVKCPLHKPALWNRASKSQKRLRASLMWNILGRSLLLAPGSPQKNTCSNSEPRATLLKWSGPFHGLVAWKLFRWGSLRRMW